MEEPMQEPRNPEQEVKKRERKLKVQKDGTVVMTEYLTVETKFTPHQFDSFVNRIKEQKREVEHQLSDDYKNHLEESKKKVEEDLNLFEPYSKESREKTKEAYEEKRKEAKVTKIKEILDKKERTEADKKMLSDIWANMKASETKALTDNEKAKVKRLIK